MFSCLHANIFHFALQVDVIILAERDKHNATIKQKSVEALTLRFNDKSAD